MRVVARRAQHTDRGLERVQHCDRNDTAPVALDNRGGCLTNVVANTDCHARPKSRPDRTAIFLLVNSSARDLKLDDEIKSLLRDLCSRRNFVELFGGGRGREIIQRIAAILDTEKAVCSAYCFDCRPTARSSFHPK